jgi:hypothetical protein
MDEIVSTSIKTVFAPSTRKDQKSAADSPPLDLGLVFVPAYRKKEWLNYNA